MPRFARRRAGTTALGILRAQPHVGCPGGAVGFPLAAAAVASVRLAGARPSLLGDLGAVIAGMLVRTLIGLAKGQPRTLGARAGLATLVKARP